MRKRVSRALGEAIASGRRARRMTQAALASAAGLDRTALSKIEGGKRRIDSLELARLARALGRTAESLLSGRSGSVGSLRDLRRHRRKIAELAARHGAHSVRVFGSVARGEAGDESDIDLLVRMDRDRTLFDQAALLADLQDLLGRDVDVVTEEGLRGSMRDRVLRDAVPL